MGRPDFESKWKCKMKKEVSLLLCFLHCCPFIQLFLLSASLAALIIADPTFSLLVTAPTARVCMTEQAGTNHIGLFKPGWSASNCAIGPRGESACTLAAACGLRDMDPIGHRRAVLHTSISRCPLGQKRRQPGMQPIEVSKILVCTCRRTRPIPGGRI